jgi:hypothetical protein
LPIGGIETELREKGKFDRLSVSHLEDDDDE